MVFIFDSEIYSRALAILFYFFTFRFYFVDNNGSHWIKKCFSLLNFFAEAAVILLLVSSFDAMHG